MPTLNSSPDASCRTAAVGALHRCPALVDLGAKQLFQLLEGSTTRTFSPDEALWKKGEPAESLVVVLSGQVILRDAEGAALAEFPGPVALGIDEALDGELHSTTVTARSGVQVLEVGIARLRSLLARSPAFRRMQVKPNAIRLASWMADADRQTAVWAFDSGVPGTGRLLTWVAEIAARKYGDRVAVLHIRDLDQTTPLPESGPAPGQALHVDIGRNLPGLVDRADFRALCARTDIIALDAGEAPQARAAALAVADTWLVLETPSGGAPAAAESNGATRFPAVVMPPLGSGKAVQPSRGATRLSIDLRRALDKGSLDALHKDDRAALERWTRAATDRTVGLALGGGGAWGYLNVELIRALHRVGVPIDVISGASFGALVGAAYCVGGLEALARLVKYGAWMRPAVAANLVSSAGMFMFVRALLGNHMLEALPTPLLPVATDVDRARLHVLREMSVAEAIRASGAFPMVFPTAVSRVAGDLGWARLVDGGIASNVPDECLAAEGADFIIAANVVPPPRPPETIRLPILGGRAGRVLSELNPLRRLTDGTRSVFILMHHAGQADANLADVLHRPGPSSFLPHQFHEGSKIIEEAKEAVMKTANDARRKFEQRANLNRAP